MRPSAVYPQAETNVHTGGSICMVRNSYCLASDGETCRLLFSLARGPWVRIYVSGSWWLGCECITLPVYIVVRGICAISSESPVG